MGKAKMIVVRGLNERLGVVLAMATDGGFFGR